MIRRIAKHRNKVVFFSPAIILLAIFGNTILLGDKERESTINIDPGSNRFETNSFFSAKVSLDVNTAVNAIEATIVYPSDLIEVTSLASDDSFIDLWINEPNYDNELGKISFTGGSTGAGGFIGPGHITTVYFKTVAPGSVKLDFQDARILAHDGVGSDIVDQAVDAEFIVSSFENVGGMQVDNQESVSLVITPETPPSTDVNNDGATNIKDISIFTVNLTGKYKPAYDFNLDGEVSIKDMSIILSASWQE